jgi:hypothetical protein
LPDAGIVRVGEDTAQVGSTLTIATDSEEGTGAGTPGIVDVPFGGTIINTYPAGSTITFANGDVRTITSIVQGNVGLYLNISYSGTATASSPEFPIILKTANYAAATTAPEWTFDTTGNLTLPTGGEIKTAAGTGDVVIEANDGTARTWTFGGDGDLTLPASGDVVNSTGVSQLANRVEGSWTVTTGTNTYSFTVPSEGTYTMWVKGKMDGGIITWNATLSITNTNVPAIGTQYAWNYTGSGSPILLTAIPDQIRGAAGEISTDATYAGSTSNRFDFGISNTSGSSKTIYYGYTKV